MGGPLFDLHLNIPVVEPDLSALETEHRDLQTAWRSALRMVGAGEAGFGDADILSSAFLPGYEPRDEALRAEGEIRLGQLDELIRSGFDCVDIYLQGDANAAIPFTGMN